MLTPAFPQPDFSDFAGKLQQVRSPLLLSARLANGQVFLKWETAPNRRTEFFEIERSSDGRFFVSIGRIIGHSHPLHPQAFTFTDPSPRKSLNFYRLRLMDAEQEFLSRIAAVAIGKNMAALIDALPNPFSDKLKISILSPAVQDLALRVTDNRGMVMFTGLLRLSEGSSLHEFDFKSLPPGQYMFTFTGPDSLVVKRLQKQ